MLYSGIDLHKRSLVIHTLHADGTTTREAQLKSDRSAVLVYFGSLAGPHRAVVECVQSWYWLRESVARMNGRPAAVPVSRSEPGR